VYRFALLGGRVLLQAERAAGAGVEYQQDRADGAHHIHGLDYVDGVAELNRHRQEVDPAV